jgi:SAM-dependent methyltransferase
MDASQIAAYWSTPEAVEANRRDWILAELERRAICAYVRGGMKVLDVGCGNGETLDALARTGLCLRLEGVDASATMIASARDKTAIRQWRIEDIASLTGGPWDLIYTERSIINLPDWPTQAKAIRDICGLLAPGGRYLMVEHSQDGLDQCNEWRARLNLPAIAAPEHCRYLVDAEVDALTRWAGDLPHDVRPDWEYGFRCQECGSENGNPAPVEMFAGTYYFLSRIVNAACAAGVGQEPRYDSAINQLALELPLGPGPQGFRGYSRAWCWRRT